MNQSPSFITIAVALVVAFGFMTGEGSPLSIVIIAAGL